MEWVIAAVVVAVLGLLALVAVGRFGGMRDVADRDVFAQPLPCRPLHGEDLSTVRFGVTLRGYAMNQVDDLLDRLALELLQRDRELEELRVELRLSIADDPFAKYRLDGGQGLPEHGPWYDGDNHPDPDDQHPGSFRQFPAVVHPGGATPGTPAPSEQQEPASIATPAGSPTSTASPDPESSRTPQEQ